MSRVRTFFLREGAECLSTIREEVGKPTMDAGVVYRAIRRFRGSAQMAGLSGPAERALTLEERLRRDPEEVRDRPRQPGGHEDAGGTEALRPEVLTVLELLEQDVEAVREGRLEGDPRMEAGMEEQGVGVGAGAGAESGPAGEAAADVVPIEDLEYRGEAALDRALQLRPALQNAIVSDEPSGPLLEELFDLIRLGLK